MKPDEADMIVNHLEDAAWLLENAEDSIEYVKDASSEDWQYVNKTFTEMMNKWHELHDFLIKKCNENE